jgi:trk system potassium uptake protein TrkA
MRCLSESDLAEKYAVRYSSNNLFDYFELTKDVSIYEIPPLDSWMERAYGKSMSG